MSKGSETSSFNTYTKRLLNSASKSSHHRTLHSEFLESTARQIEENLLFLWFGNRIGIVGLLHDYGYGQFIEAIHNRLPTRSAIKESLGKPWTARCEAFLSLMIEHRELPGARISLEF